MGYGRAVTEGTGRESEEEEAKRAFIERETCGTYKSGQKG